MDGSGGGHARPGVAGAAPVPHHQVGGGRGAGLLHLQPGLATAHSPPSQGLQVRHPYRIIKTGRQRSSLLVGGGTLSHLAARIIQKKFLEGHPFWEDSGLMWCEPDDQIILSALCPSLYSSFSSYNPGSTVQ